MEESEASRLAITIIVCNYNGQDFIKRCIASCLKSKYDPLDVLIIDDGSTDFSLECVKDAFKDEPMLKVVTLSQNMGLPACRNLGVIRTKSRVLMFLDADAYLHPNCIVEMVRILDTDPSVGIVQATLLSARRESFADCLGGYVDLLGYPYELGHDDSARRCWDKPYEAFYAKGAAFMVRRKTLFEAGLFDTDLKLFYDDTDFSWRVRKLGYKVVVCPRAIAYHYGGASRNHDSKRAAKITFYMERNRLISLFKNHSLGLLTRIFPIALIVTLASALLRAVRGRDQEGFIRLLALFWIVKHLGILVSKRSQRSKAYVSRSSFLPYVPTRRRLPSLSGENYDR
ncbi:MAG: glycosyltransferase family 2 protein [archaeon]|nr:glycosyltransferase family 2 protein [archaeon]